MRTFIFIAAALLATACTENVATPEAAAPEASTLALEALTLSDMQGRLGGELGCSFRVGEDMLFLAMGFVAAPQEYSEALAKHGGGVVELRASAPGGFDTLDDGGTFTADGFSVELRPGAPQNTGNEQTAYNATLIARDASGERSYEGVWTCGP